MRVVSLYRYPVKGLSAEQQPSLALRRGEYVPGDRLFAVENGLSGFDPAAPQYQPKIKYLMLMRNERLAQQRSRFDDASTTLRIDHGPDTLAADVSSGEGRRAVAAWFRATIADELRGEPRLLTAPPGYRFTDSRRGYVSIVGLASVAKVAAMAGRAVDPLRFRANIYVEGLAPFAELDLVGTTLRGPSGVRLRVTKRTVRCAAVNVDPTTGARDMEIPALLLRELGHMDCGVYAEVTGDGAVEPGDDLVREPPDQGALAL